jgi:hypothetical protein
MVSFGTQPVAPLQVPQVPQAPHAQLPSQVRVRDWVPELQLPQAAFSELVTEGAQPGSPTQPDHAPQEPQPQPPASQVRPRAREPPLQLPQFSVAVTFSFA